jgi:hypothetical protein
MKRRRPVRRRLLALVGFVTGALAGTVAVRRWFGGRRERLEVYFDDGSFVTFLEGSSEAARLLPLAREALASARRA